MPYLSYLRHEVQTSKYPKQAKINWVYLLDLFILIQYIYFYGIRKCYMYAVIFQRYRIRDFIFIYLCVLHQLHFTHSEVLKKLCTFSPVRINIWQGPRAQRVLNVCSQFEKCSCGTMLTTLHFFSETWRKEKRKKKKGKRRKK